MSAIIIPAAMLALIGLAIAAFEIAQAIGRNRPSPRNAFDASMRRWGPMFARMNRGRA